MAKAKARVSARKVKDKWRAKVWYRVLAPSLFNNVVIAETPAASQELLINRVAETSLQDLTGDFRKSHIKLYFKIDSVEGTDAHTYFVGHSMTNDYIRRLVRRRRSKIDGVFDVTTRDGAIIRVKPLATTDKRIQTSQKRMIRAIMKDVIFAYAKERTLDELIKGIMEEDLSKEIAKACKKFYPLRRVEIYKTELLKRPEPAKEEEKKEEVEEKAEEQGAGEVTEEKSQEEQEEAEQEKEGEQTSQEEQQDEEQKEGTAEKNE